MTRISSKKYLAGSKGAQCSLRIPGFCNSEPETVVPCHIRDVHTGGAQKASDISVANGCSGCHRALDLNMISREDWLFYALRGLQETLEQRYEAGLLIVPVDVETKLMDRPIAARKPKDHRKSIQSRPFPQGKRKFGN